VPPTGIGTRDERPSASRRRFASVTPPDFAVRRSYRSPGPGT
jgi:hypothetical protein